MAVPNENASPRSITAQWAIFEWIATVELWLQGYASDEQLDDYTERAATEMRLDGGGA